MDIEKRKKQVKISSNIALASILVGAFAMVIYLLTENDVSGITFLACGLLFVISIAFYKDDQTSLDEFNL